MAQFVIHYLDDFLFAGRPGSFECGDDLQRSLLLCGTLGVQISKENLEGPTTQIEFLGIMNDTERLELRLPEEKLTRLKRLTQRWRAMKSCTKRDLLSLIGQLQHACKVVRPGRTFLHHMIELSTIANELHHHIRLNKEFHSDLEWWVQFLPSWNGVSMMSSVCPVPHSETVTASGGWGCGAFSGVQWFQVEWPESWATVHITVK